MKQISTGKCSAGRCRRGAGFTLVELLVVIGIIALLISILLPVLGRAREAGNTIKCEANLRSIGQGLAIYVSTYKGAFPASYTYAGMSLGGNSIPTSNQYPLSDTFGYVHWSSFLYKTSGAFNVDSNQGVPMSPATSIYHTTSGWNMFQCPSLQDGGLPPCNTYAANLGPGQVNDPATANGYVDQQAPRCSYTANEAIMGRNKYQPNMADDSGSPCVRTYRYVRASQVHNSANTVLATEFTQTWQLVTDSGGSVANQPCKSHRPVHGFWSAGPVLDICEVGAPIGGFGRSGVSVIFHCNTTDLTPNLQPGAVSSSRLDWVGRNHGTGKDNSGRPLAKSNFLYCDGHVESKRVEETVSPIFQWGEQFYSLYPNGDIASTGH